jgi:hypothetical protein
MSAFAPIFRTDQIMQKPDPEIPEDFLNEFTTRASVLGEMYRQLGDPSVAREVITGLVTRDPKAHQRFLDGLKPDRWPLGRLDLCIRIPDYIRREITSPPRDVDVWVVKVPLPPLTPEQEWQFFIIGWLNARRGNDTSTRQAPVFEAKNGLLPMGVRTIVPDGPYQDDLKAAGFLQPAFERVRDIFEVNWPTGDFLTLCLPG